MASTKQHNIVAELQALGVTVRSKSESKLMRFIALFMGSAFLTRFWTTIGRNTIWAPTTARLSDLSPHTAIILHELVHIRQIRKYSIIFHVSFLWFPLPFLLAWGRWRWEREAYMETIRHGGRYEDEIEWIVNTLWSNYGWCWPKKWMRRWFLKQLVKEGLR